MCFGYRTGGIVDVVELWRADVVFVVHADVFFFAWLLVVRRLFC
jgi:hypothetical protein